MIKNLKRADIEVKAIEIPTSQLKGQVEGLLMDVGKAPFVWYNGIVIPSNYISSFELNTDGFFPVLKMFFSDLTSTMKNETMALDNSIISIYIDSRTKDDGTSPILMPIRMDFKIVDYAYLDDDDLYYIKGFPNVDGLYIPEIKSYSDMSSYEVMNKISKKLKLGFSTNISSTNDKMKWLNIGVDNSEFIQETTSKAYKSDSNFFHSFIDYYYNLTFIDVETQLVMDAKTQKGVVTTSHITIGEPDAQILSEMFLTTKNVGHGVGNNIIETYTMLNKSTKVSLQNGYRTELYYYDRTGNWTQKAGSFIKFNIETNTDGKGIVMKGSPSDTKPKGFFKSNTKKVYMNPLDVDNTHKHYNYATLINKYNNDEIDKVSLSVTLESPNFNLHKYHKIQVYIFQPNMGVSEELLNQRLSGGWVITSINFTYTPEEGLKQHIKMIKRELSDKNFSY
jgi:hypothetical protein